VQGDIAFQDHQKSPQFSCDAVVGHKTVSRPSRRSSLGRAVAGLLILAALSDAAALRYLPDLLCRNPRKHLYLSRDEQFRLTVDSYLQFAGVRHNHRRAIDSLRPVRTLIIERKFGPEFAEDADTVTNAFPFRVARFSKYVAGIECM
jgi:hypothetical protein